MGRYKINKRTIAAQDKRLAGESRMPTPNKNAKKHRLKTYKKRTYTRTTDKYIEYKEDEKPNEKVSFTNPFGKSPNKT